MAPSYCLDSRGFKYAQVKSDQIGEVSLCRISQRTALSGYLPSGDVWSQRPSAFDNVLDASACESREIQRIGKSNSITGYSPLMKTRVVRGRIVEERDASELCVENSPFLDVAVIEAILAHHARVFEARELGNAGGVQFILVKGGKHERSNNDSDLRDSA